MGNVYIQGVNGGETTTPTGEEGIELDDGSTSTWIKIKNLIGRKLRETAGPTTLSMGAVVDGEYLKRSGTSIIGASVEAGIFMQARLTLETGVPFSVTDQTAKTHLYITKYNGNKVTVFDGSGTPTTLTLGSDIDINLSGLGRSQAYTNDPAAGSSITLNMASTTGFILGDRVKVSSSAGSEEAVITAVVANTSITVDALALNHTTSSPLVTGGLTYDVFVYNNSGTLAAETLAWTNNSTRATALTTTSGVDTKTGDSTRRFIGTFRTTTNLGECEISSTRCLVSNNDNQLTHVLARSYISSHTYTTATWRAWNNSAINAEMEFVSCKAVNVMMIYRTIITATTGGGVSFTINDSTFNPGGVKGEQFNSVADVGSADKFVGRAGYNYLVGVEYGGTTITTGRVSMTCPIDM